MAYFISRMIFKITLLMFFGFKVMGRENIPKKGPFIIAANHASIADPPVMGAACNTVPLAFIAKQELFDSPSFGWWFRATGCIPAARESGSARALKEAVRKLKEGRAIGVFPEGTRSPDGRLRKAEPGIGLIAAKSGAPIVPMFISGTNKAIPKGKKGFKLSKITARIGEAITTTEKAGPSDRRKVYASIGEKVMAAIAELKNEQN